jgi:hypothetical protein
VLPDVAQQSWLGSVGINGWHAVEIGGLDGDSMAVVQLFPRWYVAEDLDQNPLVLISQHAGLVAISVPMIRWQGQIPVLLPGWMQIVRADVPPEEFGSLVREARRKRLSAFRRCAVCGNLTAPEHREGSFCHAHSGAVF